MGIKHNVGSAYNRDFSLRLWAGLSLVLASCEFSVTTLPISWGAFSSRAHKAAEEGNVLYHLSPENPQVKVRPPVLEP